MNSTNLEKSLAVLALALAGVTAAYLSVIHVRWMFRKSVQPAPSIQKVTSQSRLNMSDYTRIYPTRSNIRS